ncbi:MAG: hypothetical protein WCX29_02030 [Candidatus Peribacteraceae bacterium]
MAFDPFTPPFKERIMSSTQRLFCFDEDVALQLGVSPGWSRGGNGIIEQPKLGVTVRWVCWMADGQFRYDQILRAEKPGAVFLLVADHKVGLIKQYRPQARDMDRYEQLFPNFVLGNIGRESWEAPRGFRIPGTSAAQTARIEAEAETGGRLVSQQGLHACCDNTAFSPHLTYLSFGEIDLSRRVRDEDPLEQIIEKLKWFSLSELNGLEEDGTYYCGYTATCIERVLRRYPGILR